MITDSIISRTAAEASSETTRWVDGVGSSRAVPSAAVTGKRLYPVCVRACSTAPTAGPVPGAAAGTARMLSSGIATSATTRLRICSARVSRMLQSNRNHPSIIIWSLGNESGGGGNHDAGIVTGLVGIEGSERLGHRAPGGY